MSKVLDVTIVVPTKNEEKMLPLLLQSIKKQTIQPKEVIVADASSTDRTVEIAKEYGARVVPGGIISVGRNNGALAAKTKYILFCDADATFLSPTTLEKYYQFFESNKLELSSALMRPTFEGNEGFIRKRVIWFMFGLWNKLKMQNKRKNAPVIESGTGIFVTQELFRKLGGFYTNTEIIAEDAEFTKRAIQSGVKYDIFREGRIGSSGRRYKSILGTIKTIIAAVFFYLLSTERGLRFAEKNPRISKFFLSLYGPLGG